MKRIIILAIISIFNFQFSISLAQCPEALRRYAERYPAAEPQDLYKLVFQDIYGPGHLLTDSLDAVSYISKEVAEMVDPRPNELPFPLYEYTLCDSNFVRVNLLLIKWDIIPLDHFVSALLRSAKGLPMPDPKFIQTHSNVFKAAYDPHYRIIRRDIFEREIKPLIEPHDSIPESNPVIVKRIGEWQDLKFGFMMHWGIYAQWGVVESWSICNESWITRERLGANGRPVKGTKGEDFYKYKQAYQALNKTFNPKHFSPEQWAAAAKKVGMKYVVFTTKHHDGFCMFDSRYTDYTSMGQECPAKTDFTRGVVDAFRSAGFWTGLYFSKPDWHCDDYWAHEWSLPDRNVNYSIADHPDRWQRFCDFTYNQIHELTHNYGSIDILWLDGGWVRPAWSVNDETRPWLGCSGQVQDIDMPRIAAMARENNPQMIIVDRSVGGCYENYRTPEKQVPDTLLPYPWETCMTMGDSWSYVPNDNYKSTKTLIHMLCDVVAKGGNLLLNVGPDADGNLPAEALQRMEEIGKWLDKNGYAIYGTRPLTPYCDDNKRYTQSKDGKHRYEITLIDQAPYATVKEIKKKDK